jgi:hypothetical protein
MRIPGFRDQAPVAVIKEAIKDFLADDMMTYAAALAHRILLALFLWQPRWNRHPPLLLLHLGCGVALRSRGQRCDPSR